MKKKILFLLIIFNVLNFSFAQDWMTNIDVAKRLALTQNKMLLAMWEDAYSMPYPQLIKDENGRTYLVDDIFSSEFINSKIWEYFVPVVIKESQYEKLYAEIKNKRSLSYINRFNDDFIKIMDVNGNILNTKTIENENFLEYINLFALNTSYLKNELNNYKLQKNIITSYHLAAKYIDVAMYANEDVRQEIIDLSTIYLDEAKMFLETDNPSNKNVIQNLIDLQEIKQLIVLNQIRKAKRLLKKFDTANLEKLSKPLFAFLKYTILLISNDDNAERWKDSVTTVDKKKTSLLIKNYLKTIGNTN